MTRIGVLSVLAALALPASSGEVAKWWKGMLHSHTCWSDGSAFPEQAIEWYRSHGYHFYAMSDHNVFAADVDHWLTVSAKDGKYPPLNPMQINYRHGFPDQKMVEAYRRDWKAEERLSRNGNWSEIRLKTYAECARLFNEKGKFLLVPAVEASHAVSYSNGVSHQVHCNYMGVCDLLPIHRLQNWGWTGYDVPLAEYIEMLRAQSEAKGKELGAPSLFTLNHPIWEWYDVPPEALVDAPNVRFFEVCNNGGGKAAPELPQDGFDTDRFWDVVNAFRTRRGQPLLYGTGVDDVHAYGLGKGGACGAGDAWIRVNSPELTMESLFAAMNAGDFVTCCGLEPERVAFDRTAGRLEVSVAAKPGVPYVIRFIVTKRDFSEKPMKTFEVHQGKARPKDGKKPSSTRVINVYDEKVGLVVKTVEGKPGEALSAAYEMAADDLYVRARIESPTEKPHSCCPLHPKCRVAWTQPYAKDAGPGTYFVPEKGTANVTAKVAAKPGSVKRTVAFLGGSITEMNGFRPRVMKLLREKYPDVAFTEIASGLSSTCSDAGAFRLEEDVLAKGVPDLFVVEAAVNDDQDGHFSEEHSVRGMEGTVRHVLERAPDCAVVVGLMVNAAQYKALMNGETPKHYAAHARVAKHYGAAVADVGSALAEEAKRGGMTWKEYRDCHPSPAGCDLGAKVVMAAIDRVFDPRAPKKARPMPPPLDAHSYSRGVAVPAEKLTLGEGWQVSRPDWQNVPGSKRGYFTQGPAVWSETAGAELSFSFVGDAVGLFLTAGPDAGDVEATVDGKSVPLLKLRASYGSLHYPYVHMVADGLAETKHTVRLKVAAATRGGKACTAVRIHRIFVNGAL